MFTRVCAVIAILGLTLTICLAYPSPARSGESIWDRWSWGSDDDGGNVENDEDDDTAGWGDPENELTTTGGEDDDWGVPPSPPKGNPPPAKRKEGSLWLQKMREDAEKGKATSQFEMGLAYVNGSEGVAVNLEEAARWYAMAAEQNHSGAANNLAVIYRDSFNRGEEAITLFKRSAELGEPVAMYNLGKTYRDGNGVPADADQAIVWLSRAVDNNVPQACLDLGLLFYRRDDITKAGHIFEKGASLDNSVCTFNYALYLFEGWGDYRADKSLAFTQFLKSANLGHVPAMYRTGQCHLEGDGVEVNLPQAKKWLTKAQNHGFEGSEELLARIPANVEIPDDGPIRLSARQLIEEFAADAQAAAKRFTGREIEILGGSGNVSISMINSSSSAVITEDNQSIKISADIPPKGNSSNVNYSPGNVLKARFDRFDARAHTIFLVNGETVPQ